MRTDTREMNSSMFDMEDTDETEYRRGDAWVHADDDDIFGNDAGRSAIRDADAEIHEFRYGQRR